MRCWEREDWAGKVQKRKRDAARFVKIQIILHDKYVFNSQSINTRNLDLRATEECRGNGLWDTVRLDGLRPLVCHGLQLW